VASDSTVAAWPTPYPGDSGAVAGLYPPARPIWTVAIPGRARSRDSGVSGSRQSHARTRLPVLGAQTAGDKHGLTWDDVITISRGEGAVAPIGLTCRI
jgi:hypothetical protein